MAKINYEIIPEGWLPLVAKILRWYNQRTHATFATKNRQGSRADKEQRETVSYFKEVADNWNPLAMATKNYWSYAGGYCAKTRYRLFLADYAFRKRTGLDKPGTPNNYHQLWGLLIKDSGGDADVQATWKTIAVTGQITVRFSIAKTEITPPTDYSFRVRAVATYFEGGENKTETHTYTTPEGNMDWGWQEFTFGTANRSYFELEIFLELYKYDAEVLIDNLMISDNSGELYYEYFNPVRPYDWEPTPLFRKEGWAWSPFFTATHFQQKFIE